MKHRIWRRIRRTGIAAAAAGAVLSGGFRPETVKSADLADTNISIAQTGNWTDRENGKAELQIQVEGLGSWLAQREETVENTVQDQENSRGKPDVTEEQSNFEHENINYEYADKDQERKGEYEYVEELASGKTVQQENEEQEETGAGPQEGETAGGEDIEEAKCEQLAYAEPSEGKIPNIAPEETPIPEETLVPSAVQQGLTLITYISEYFSPEISEIPGDISVTPITIKNQKGKSIEIIKLEYKINTENMPEETLSLRIPLTLREEYRYPAEVSSYSLVQDEPLKKDRNSAGTFLLMEENEETQILAEGISPSLDVEAAQEDMNLTVTSETKEMKAGKTIRYRIDLINTGKLDLTDIHLTSMFSCPKIIQCWENGEGLSSGNFQTEGAKAEVFTLKAGESRILYVLAPLVNEQEKPLEHKIEAIATIKEKPDATITRTASVTDELQALKADFTVKKTADREKAEPGETVTYQICIVNTGEKTLHSVVGTERFQAEGIQAQFVEQEGITLNRTKTKALISQISPGEAVSLRAVVKIPEKTVNQKLLNQVTVTSQETGDRIVEAAAQVTVKNAVMTEAPTDPQQEQPQMERVSEEQNNAAIQSGSQARSASSQPKTGDNTKSEFFILMMLAAGLTMLGAFWLHRKYRDIHEKDH